MLLNLLLNVSFIQNLVLCHVLFTVVAKDDLPRCSPRNLLNLYNLPTRNSLDLIAKALAACTSAVFFLLWRRPLTPLKMKPPTFFIPETIFPKMLPPLKIEVIPQTNAPKNLYCLEIV